MHHILLIVGGSLLLALGAAIRPFTTHFWQTGFSGGPGPGGWSGCLDRIAGGVFLLALLTRAAFKVPIDLLCIAGGMLLLAYGTCSWSALPLSLVFLGAVLTSLVICWAYVLLLDRSSRFMLAQLLLGAGASAISYLRGIPDRTHTLAVLRGARSAPVTGFFVSGARSQAITALCWLPSASDEEPESIVAAEDGRLQFWHSGRVNKTLFPQPPDEEAAFAQGTITDLSLSPDHRYLAAADREGHITFFTRTPSRPDASRSVFSQTLLNLRVDQTDLESRHPGVHYLESVNAVAWAPTLPYQVAFGANDHSVKVWCIGQAFAEHPARWPTPASAITRQHQVFVYRQHQQRTTAVAWSPDGERIASASADATVHIWQVATGETVRIFRGHQEAIHALAWSPNGELLASGSADGMVHVWQALTGETIATHQGQKGSALPVAWSPDGQWLAWAGQQHTARLWEVSTGRIATYQKHTRPVLAISWSADGDQIASGGEDRTVRVWEAPHREGVAG